VKQPQARNISYTDYISVQPRTTGPFGSASRGGDWRLPAADASLRTISVQLNQLDVAHAPLTAIPKRLGF
jgi:hypothetical protein